MRSNRKTICLFGIILCGLTSSMRSAVHAQTPDPTSSSTPQPKATPSLEREFFKNIIDDQKAIWTSPFHLHARDARWAAPLALGTAALITTDRRTGDEMAEFHAQLKTSRRISYVGSMYGTGGIAASFYLIGRATNNQRARETGFLSAEALVDSLILESTVKEITQRARPRAGIDRSEFFEKGTSFPSGHSMQAWSVATVVANEYHDHPLVQVGAYGLASAVSIARFTGRYHYLSDVLIGGAMGYGIGRYVYRTHHRKLSSSGGDQEESRRASKLWPMIAPQYNRRAHDYAIALSWSF